jgi:diguanylate cyclase (GGDEF)-like protein
MATTTLDGIQSLGDPLLENSWELRSRDTSRREFVAETGAAALFALCSGGLVALAGSAAPPLWLSVLLVGLYALVSRVEFPVGAGYVVPTQLVLVPMLLLLPPAVVPPLVAAGMMLGAVGDWVTRRGRADRVLFSVPDAWHALGPAVVLSFAGDLHGALPPADVLVLAFVAGCGVDMLSATLREAAALGIAPGLQLRAMAQVWIADACLAPIGLVAAQTGNGGFVVLLLPLAGLLLMLSRDRSARIEHAHRSLQLVRHERARLQSAVRRMGEAFASKLDLDAVLDIMLRGSLEAVDADAALLTISAPGCTRALQQGATGDLLDALRDAAESVAPDRDGTQLLQNEIWTLVLPFTLDPSAESATGIVCLARRDRPFGKDEIALLAELARRAAAAGSDILAHNELREQAFTDPLTGLGNRRSLRADLERRCASADTASPSLLLLFDLDGFKSYNDTFGHLAGDSLLALLGSRLSAAARPHGAAYRLGGDEFCVLMDVPDEHLSGTIASAADALTEHGEGFAIGPSYGAVLVPHEAANPDQALQRADERMYERKTGRRASAARDQVAEVLRRTMEVKQPQLGSHSSGVAQLAVAVARRLGMAGEQLDEVGRAAELHDVGKVGIPDRILNKPGPLDRAEWDFMRQHTILGERILSAAPALRPIAVIVRASHERWDGKGYPDGLAGEDIPAAARIVAVCDAYEAMTADRAYSPAIDPEDACDELRAMAGTQFAPEVVEAFVAEIASSAAKASDTTSTDGEAAQITARVRGLLGSAAAAS